ncbi:MAG: proton-conducting transporter membrane subunit [Candidatus Aerophobetes bacterium]|nr:proton-conducting transporter membrane subunit [Candidatus Aerophobetes bacterium]
MNNIPLFLIIIPLFAACLILLINFFKPHPGLTQLISLSSIIISLIILGFSTIHILIEKQTLIYNLGGWEELVGISLHLDGLAWFSSSSGAIIALFSLVYSLKEKIYQYKFYFFFSILVTGMQGVVLTHDIFNMFVFFEILSIASYILIAYSQEGKAIKASFHYLIISSLGASLFLLGIGLIYQGCGSLSLTQIGKTFSIERGIPSSMFQLTISLIVVGIGIRAAFIPLHLWLPDAHGYAPTPVSALLSGITIKISFLAIWRIISILEAINSQHFFLWIGSLTALIPVIWALSQTDIKKLLAYHSISQMGFIIVSFGIGSALSLTGSLYHFLNHSFFKSLLFFSMGAVIYTTGKRDLRKLSGLFKKMPWVAVPSLIGALSISGIPPFNGFVSRTLIATSLKKYPLPLFFIFLASVGTAASFIKLMMIFLSKEKVKPLPHKKIKKAPKTMIYLLITLSIISLLSGIFPSWIVKVISNFILLKDLPSPIKIYSFSNIGKSLLIFVLGIFLYKFITTKYGKQILLRIRDTEPGLNNSLLLVILSLILFFILTIPGKY